MMTNTHIAIEGIQLAVGLLCLWVLGFHFWKDLIVDEFRQRLFNLRGELFDYACEHGLPFDHPAYGLLRRRINRLIQYAHRFNSVHLFFAVLDRNPVEPPVREVWLRALDEVEDERVRVALLNLEATLSWLMVTRIVFGSPTLLVLFGLVMAWAILQGAAKAATEQFMRLIRLDSLEAQALEQERWRVAA